jgi:hypothetical protein
MKKPKKNTQKLTDIYYFFSLTEAAATAASFNKLIVIHLPWPILRPLSRQAPHGCLRLEESISQWSR